MIVGVACPSTRTTADAPPAQAAQPAPVGKKTAKNAAGNRVAVSDVMPGHTDAGFVAPADRAFVLNVLPPCAAAQAGPPG